MGKKDDDNWARPGDKDEKEPAQSGKPETWGIWKPPADDNEKNGK